MATEKRMIDANALMGTIADIMRELPDPKDHYDNGYYSGLDRVFELVEQAPSVQIVHSQWDSVFYERNGTLASYSHICPVCKYFYRDVKFKGHNYCPNCGAKMDGDGNG